MNLRGKGCEVLGCMHVAQDRDNWRDLVNVVMKLRVP